MQRVRMKSFDVLVRRNHMADEKEFNPGEARERLQNLARQIIPIEKELSSIVDFYSDKTPTDERDEAQYKDGMKTKLINQERAIRGFIDREF
jgi:hypothetical protein